MIIHNSGTLTAPETAVALGNFNDVIRNTGIINGNVTLGDGNDTYAGYGGMLDGTVFGGDGGDSLLGGAFDDSFLGEAGNDYLIGRGGDDVLAGGDGKDEIRGGADDDLVLGGDGNDELHGGDGDDLLNGGNGKDDMRGGHGDDLLVGLGGNDILNGGRDNDELSGGAGADIFEFFRNAGDDVITDFVDGVDRIDLTAFGLRPVDFAAIVAPALSNAGGGATMLDLSQLGGQGSVLIEGLAFANADVSDFIL